MPAFSCAKPHVPELFKVIMKNHRDQEAILAVPVVGAGTGVNCRVVSGPSFEQWQELKELFVDRKMQRRAAEKALRHNVDKGSTG